MARESGLFVSPRCSIFSLSLSRLLPPPPSSRRERLATSCGGAQMRAMFRLVETRESPAHVAGPRPDLPRSSTSPHRMILLSRNLPTGRRQDSSIREHIRAAAFSLIRPSLLSPSPPLSLKLINRQRYLATYFFRSNLGQCDFISNLSRDICALSASHMSTFIHLSLVSFIMTTTFERKRRER